MTRPVLITGGAGFIGTNLAAHLAGSGRRVRILDDLSRTGVDRNLVWLQRKYGERIEPHIGDVRDRELVRTAVAGVDAVFHLAAQVATTASLVDPIRDFEINARGTLELLEAVRRLAERPAFLYTSTSKVYGTLAELPLQLAGERWVPTDAGFARRGVDETRRLDMRTPHACSKGAADQYVLDYAHCYGVPATVFRASTIYGPHQFGTEEQGWIAHFLARAIKGERITIYGDGRQVRDVLYVDDLVAAMIRAWSRIGALAGRAFNLGGGPEQALSPRDLLAMIEELRGARPEIQHETWRTGDQRYYVSDTTAFRELAGWQPRVQPRAGVEALHGWLVEQGAPRG